MNKTTYYKCIVPLMAAVITGTTMTQCGKAQDGNNKNKTEVKDSLPETDYTKTVSMDAKTIANKLYIDSINIYTATSEIDGGIYRAKDRMALDKFETELASAKNDKNKLQALFHNYAKTEDIELAKSLATNCNLLCAKDEDLISLVNNNNLDVILSLPLSSVLEANKATFGSAKVVNAVSDRIVKLLKGNPNNVKNMQNIDTYFAWIDMSKKPYKVKASAKQEIINGYFDRSFNNYTFNPSDRPTQNDIHALLYEYKYDEKTGEGRNVLRPEINKGMKHAVDSYTKFRYNNTFENIE